MHIVYRMEHPQTECGPYHYMSHINKELVKEFAAMKNRHSDTRKYPTRSYDIPNSVNANYDKLFCGCHSWKLFLSWFNPMEIKQLRIKGFTVVRLRVKEIIISNSGRQCFFLRQDIIH